MAAVARRVAVSSAWPIAGFALVVAAGAVWSQGPSWDEAIYLSQVGPGPALPFAPTRARGIELLAAPVAWLTREPVAIRAWMFGLALVGISLAFRAWRGVLERRALIGAQVALCSSWVAAHYATRVMPNLFAGLAILAGVAFAERAARDGGRRDPVWLGSAFAVAALVRPADAAVAAAAIAAWAMIRRAGRWAAIAAAVAVGAAVGSLPWLAEMSVRFGGPGGALEAALPLSHVGTTGVGEGIVRYLSVADGPTTGPVSPAPVPVVGATMVAAWSALALVGVLRRGPVGTPVRLAASGGAALIAFYVAGVGGVAPRFLLPGLALLSVPAGAGLAVLWTRAGRGLRLGLVAAVGLAAIWNAQIFHDREVAAARVADANDELAALATPGRACVIVAEIRYPQLGYLTGCRARPLDETSGELLARSLGDGWCAFSVVREASPPTGIVWTERGSVGKARLLASAGC
jgi:hypothetical protein